MNIVFMGTPAFAVPTLAALIASRHSVVAVYCQPPRPAGRGMQLTACPVHQLAEHHGLPVYTPTSLKSAEAQAQFAAHDADLAVVAAYGLLLPKPILDAPRLGCLNIHPSDLPRWRGAAPIQRTLMAGDSSTACCIMQMDEGLDTGAILAREPYTIASSMDAGALHDAMAELGATLMMRVVHQLANHHPPAPCPQPRSGATYASKITKADQWIDWAQPASRILHHIRGLSPQPGAITECDGTTLKLFAAELALGDAQKPPGMLLDATLCVNCSDGTAVRILELQRPGKSRQNAGAFLAGARVPAGLQLKKPSEPQ